MTVIVKSIRQYPARWIAAAVAVALIAAYFAPLLITYPEQDTCSFGPVSNERYRALLAEAKRKQATVWPALVRDDYKAGVQLNARVDDLSRGLATVYERLAAMHAILRALGADYRAAASRDDDPYERATRMGGKVSFKYHIDINRLGMFAPIRRRGILNGGVYAGGAETGSPTDPTRYVRGMVSIAALFPKLLENYQYVPRSSFGEVCPPVPKPEQVETYTFAADQRMQGQERGK